MLVRNLVTTGNGHPRGVDDSAANYVEHISMVELGVHTPTAMRKSFQQTNSRAVDIAR